MTDKEWRNQVESIVAAAGLAWRVYAAWTEQAGTVLCAQLIDKRSGEDRTVRVSGVVFRSDTERREEITRQLQKARRGT